MTNNVGKIAALAFMTALSMVISMMESYVPIPVPVPGIKLGLANIVTLVLLTDFGFLQALAVSIARCVLTAVFSGAISAMLFSLAGGLSSCFVMGAFYYVIKMDFSLTGISIIGAAVHNAAQILVAMFLMRNTAIIYYLPVLILCSIATGFITGICATRVSAATRLVFKGFRK